MPKGERLIEFVIRVKPEDAGKFGDVISGFSGFKEVDVRSVANPESEFSRPWKEELAGLQKLVTTASVLFEARNAQVLAGYNELNVGIIERFSPLRIDVPYHPERIARHTLTLMESSVGAHANLVEKPIRKIHVGKSRIGLTYKRIGQNLTPREIRLTIFRFGLTGEKYSRDQLIAMEGIQAPYGAIHEVLWRLGDHIWYGNMDSFF